MGPQSRAKLLSKDETFCPFLESNPGHAEELKNILSHLHFKTICKKNYNIIFWSLLTFI
jgi:hypothetical protein